MNTTDKSKQSFKWILSITVIAGVIIGAVFLGNYYLQDKKPDSIIEEPSENDKPQDIRIITDNLNTPWSIVFYGASPLISSRNTGEILEILEDGSSHLITTLKNSVHRGEGGLLGLAIQDSYLYVYYTSDTDNRISRFMLSGEKGSLSMGEEELILSGLPSASYHNGGRIAFGPDGMLYAGIGDAGNTNASQDLSVLSGKILRMSGNGDVPLDNPFAGSLVYSYGHRNVQGLSWDEAGVMYASEFGQNSWDELNIIKAGANYGWPVVEGIEVHEGFEVPVQQWPVSEASPSGMTYYKGRLYLANLRGAVLRSVSIEQLSDAKDYFKNEYGRIRDLAIAPDGTLWFITNNTDGRGVPSIDDDKIISVPLEVFD